MVPRLNFILMGVLSVGLMAGVTALAVTYSGKGRRTEVSEERVDALVNRLADRDEEVVGDARRLLLRIGPDSVPRLRKALDSHDAQTRRHANELIRLLEDSGAPVEP
jgi:hypothetical protein